VFVLSYSHKKEIPVRIISLFLMSLLFLSACATDDGALPTIVDLPSSTKTLIPTQSQQLTTPTLPGTIIVADNQADINSPASTNTPIDCNLQDDWDIYTVQRGDNLANIANRTGSTIDELTQANCIDNPNRIRVGLELYVPNAPDATDSAPIIAPTIVPSVPSTIVPTVLISTVTSVPTITATSQVSTQSSISSSSNMTFESKIGFGLNLPDEWFITESATSTVENVIITSFEYTLGDEIPQNQWADDMVSITVTVFQATTTETLAQWVQSVVNQLESASNITDVLAPVTLFTGSEIQGQSIDYISDDETVIRNYYFIIKDHRVQISVGGNFDMAVPVVNSLQPA
jgi:murein DD-endopeptidase MepM/ murein hydrolase activator NlpD